MKSRITNSIARKPDKYKNVLVKCLYDHTGTSLRVRVQGELNPHWNVRFPRNLRQFGAAYVVERIVEAKGFYIAKGTITRVI